MHNVIGHTAAKNELLNHQNRKTWLITGKKGIGKATLAKSFAMHILQIKTFYEQSYISNLLVLENEVIKIEEIRNIKNFLNLSAINNPKKIVIIDSIDNLTSNAANSVLKILEEPPKNSFIILISHNHYKALQTIKSRCFPLTLSPLNTQDTLQIITNNELKIDENSKLFELYNGTPGMVTNNLENEIKFYDYILQIVKSNQPQQIEEIIKLDIDLSKIGFMALNLVGDIIKNIVDFKKEVIQLVTKNDINFWLQKYSLIQHLINSAKEFHLDKKTLILLLIDNLKDKSDHI